MLMKYSILLIAAAGVSATTVIPRQEGNGASMDLSGDLAKVLSEEFSELPDVCQSTCDPLAKVASTCQNDVQGCLKEVCTKDQFDAMVACQDCIAKELPGEIDQGNKETLGQLMEGLKQACKESGNPVDRASASGTSGTTTTSASPSKTSAASSETSNAAVAGSQVGMGAIMAALDLVAAAL